VRTEDGYIIHKCLNGESEAFGFLVDKYKASIYAFAYTKLRDFRDAEDVTQEVFIQAYQRLRTLRRWDSFLAWLYAMTANRCKNLMRSRYNRPDREFIEDQDPVDLVNPSMDSYREGLALESIHEALDLLPETYSQVLTLHYFGGMTCKEIATFLRTSPVAIKKRLSRARSQLKEEVLAAMSTTYEQQRLGASFTFRIVEMAKRIKINPVPRIPWLPWGLSLGTGLIFTVLSFCPGLLPPIEPIIASMSSSLPAEAKVSDIGAISVDILKTSEIPFLASRQGSSNGEDAGISMVYQAEGGVWTSKSDMSTGRAYVSTVAVNGKIYAIGGTSRSGHGLSSVEEYDPVTNKWTKKADMPAGGRRALSACVINGKIYAIGGEDQYTPFSTVEEYDPVANRWARKADMPTPRAFLSASAVDGKIYAIGGVTSWAGPYLSIVEEYDPVMDTWTRKSDMPTPRGGLSTSVVNGKIYAIGGSHQRNGPIDYTGLSTVEEYNPATDTWTKKADMPTARLCPAASAVNGKVHIIGGANREKSFPTVEEYDPTTDTWAKEADMPTARCTLSTSIANGRIYAIGGVDFPVVYLSTVEEYTPEGREQINPVSP
jgi:RNA polymerase sigma factor (sigma-70 family)